MAITGYFIDMNWVYREVLGFKPLSGAHTGANTNGDVQQSKAIDIFEFAGSISSVDFCCFLT
jgi:hypothetical protein